MSVMVNGTDQSRPSAFAQKNVVGSGIFFGDLHFLQLHLPTEDFAKEKPFQAKLC